MNPLDTAVAAYAVVGILLWGYVLLLAFEKRSLQQSESTQ